MTAALGEAAVGAAEGAGVGAVAPSASAPVGASTSSASGASLRTPPPKPRPAAKKTGGKKTGGTGRRTAAAAGGGGLLSKTAPAKGYRKVKQFYGPSAARQRRAGARQVIVAEFVTCALILALSPLTAKHKDDSAGQWMNRATALAFLFVVLGLVATGGRAAERLAASFGALVTVALAVQDREVFAAIVSRFGSPPTTGPAGPPPEGPQEEIGTGFGVGVPDAGASPPGRVDTPGRTTEPPVARGRVRFI